MPIFREHSPNADGVGPAGLPLGMELALRLAMLPIFEAPASQGMILETESRFSGKIMLKH